MEGPQFRQELSQQLKLCPQLMQNIALLQMNVQDLREFLERAVEENPMLEQQEPSGDAFRELSARNECGLLPMLRLSRVRKTGS